MKEFIDSTTPVKTEFPAMMSRTLSDVAHTDFFATVLLLRERYVHDFKLHEFEKVISTLAWLEKPENLTIFEKANRNPEERKFLPEDVQSSRLTINLFFELGLEVEHKGDAKIYKQPVAFALNTKEFRTDLYAITYKLFEKLENYDAEKGDSKLEKENDPAVLARISKFYKTGGHEYREEATDAVSVILFRQYWKLLKESASILSASGKLLASR